MAPPFSGAKISAPKRRSASRPSRAAANGGNAKRIKTEVSKTFQVKIGIRNMVIPGALMQRMVVMKFTPPRIVPIPLTANPITHKSLPRPGENSVLESGA